MFKIGVLVIVADLRVIFLEVGEVLVVKRTLFYTLGKTMRRN